MKNILVTGGAGFIGSNLIHFLLKKYSPEERQIFNLDALTYAGNLENLRDVEQEPHYHFLKADTTDYELMTQIISRHEIDGIINLAAESHVDRSIKDPFTFARTNVMGTLSLLQAALKVWEKEANFKEKRFYHISTDEVYGSLEPGDRPFEEGDVYDPHSPYSASKASCDHFVRSYRDTYGLPVLLSNCSNNYGPYQFPEKLIPLVINNIHHHKTLPIYGTGENIRDWLYVDDHCRAIDLILHHGRPGETYNIGGNNEHTNIEIVKLLIQIVDEELGYEKGHSLPLISFVADRKGHDKRYAINSDKIQRELGWKQEVPFEEGIRQTVRWYLAHEGWMQNVTSGAYEEYYQKMYESASGAK